MKRRSQKSFSCMIRFSKVGFLVIKVARHDLGFSAMLRDNLPTLLCNHHEDFSLAQGIYRATGRCITWPNSLQNTFILVTSYLFHNTKTTMKTITLMTMSTLVLLPALAAGGPLAYATCQSACAAALTAGPFAPAAYAACQASCAALLAAPCP